MRGSSTEPGVIPLAVHDMFETIYQDASREFLLRMSYLEIYNEDINDLLAPEHRKLQIHENLEKGIFVAGLREEIVASPQQVLEMMEFGESHRHIGETNMNVHSSRSHTIFRMIIESRQKTQDEGVGNACDAVRVSVLNLVDLAGSERASKTGAEGVRLKEGSHINKSLMTLGTVIKKLSEGVENQGGHVPYRDSKLTRILQPALGGNANTAIICNITLASKGIFVAGLREEIVASPRQVLEMMEFGESHRHIGATYMNVHSSRSHTIFRMVIESSQKTQDDDAVRVSVLNLVDLAGSERASKTGAEGVRLKEGSHINKSLMTLGTVIKKLSEGVDNQGGHIPYRDSKLTRILQPALGGNANTAIICNITLAPNHADETTSSLKFASRALRVTNCAHVNEISSDAALLKRQKKEIEELRSKPKTSHSDHSDEEILNLRNTLLKSELERERIAMELDEEKKAQAQREKVLQEQAKKIENLSSIVLFSNRDEKREQEDHFKKGKRRDTWGTGLLSRDSSTSEVQSHGLSRERFERETGPLLPFAELVKNERLCSISEQDENSIDEDSALPDPLVHVTRRKKPSSIRQKKHVMVESESDIIQREYEHLFLQYETERITNEIQIECLKARVFGNVHRDESSAHLRDPEDILLIKQLQEKINMLETEKSSSKQNLDDLVTVATEQNTCARQKIAEIQEEIHAAREEAQIAREQLVSKEFEVNHVLNEYFNSLMNVASEVEVLASEFQKFKASVKIVSSVMDEGLQDFASFSPLIHGFTLNMRQSSEQHALLISSIYQNLESCLKQKVVAIENEKCTGLQSQIEEPSQEHALMMLSDESELDLAIFNQRQRRVLWTPEEEEMLKVGVETFATDPKKNIPWKKILKMGETVFHRTRNPADLKDKWRRHNPSH
ncbi:hypothetical protein F2Q70_00009736 [Brassica cretica]|uniref:Kinesin-like protein n=1 Tax=Brassica cretica TaxID=69181 RepID=A0A8S9M3G5_BRACR|nr:hypothetical protein F2Q70_00009736 [Brassica cretica]